MDEIEKHRWQALVDSFGIQNKQGADPWDALQMQASFEGSSHGERLVIQFLLNLWDAGTDWKCGNFDVIEAFSVWDSEKQDAFRRWVNAPFWP